MNHGGRRVTRSLKKLFEIDVFTLLTLCDSVVRKV